MSDTKTPVSNDAIITVEMRCNYPTLFQPKLNKSAKPGDKPRFSLMLMFSNGEDGERLKHKDFYESLRKVALNCAVEKWGRDQVKNLHAEGKLKLGIRTDVKTKKGAPLPDDIFAWIQPWAYVQPGLVSRYKDPSTGKPMKVTDPKEIFSGCYVRASIAPFASDTNGNTSVSFGLRNVQILAPGARLDNRKDATDEFTSYEDAPADLPDEPTGGHVPQTAGNQRDELESLLG